MNSIQTAVPQWYVGVTTKRAYVPFQSAETPTAISHPAFTHVIGPYRTKRAAFWTRDHGANNPHFVHVEDAERIAKWNAEFTR